MLVREGERETAAGAVALNAGFRTHASARMAPCEWCEEQCALLPDPRAAEQAWELCDGCPISD